MRNPYHRRISEIPDEGLDLEFESTLSQIGLDGSEFRAPASLHTRLRVEKAEEVLVLEGTTRGQVDVPCVRCLKMVNVSLDMSFRLFLEPSLEAPTLRPGRKKMAQEPRREEGHDPFLSGGHILLDEVIREQVVLGVPAFPVCRDECRGLCPSCGINRNERTCFCLEGKQEPSMNRLQEQLEKFTKKK